MLRLKNRNYVCPFLSFFLSWDYYVHNKRTRAKIWCNKEKTTDAGVTHHHLRAAAAIAQLFTQKPISTVVRHRWKCSSSSSIPFCADAQLTTTEEHDVQKNNKRIKIWHKAHGSSSRIIFVFRHKKMLLLLVHLWLSLRQQQETYWLLAVAPVTRRQSVGRTLICIVRWKTCSCCVVYHICLTEF